MVYRIDSGKLVRPPYRSPQGHLRAEAYATRVGIFPYVNADGSLRWELRHPNEVFDERSLATLGGVPITIGHPKERVTPDNFKNLGKGVVGDDVVGVNPYVKVSLNIQAQDAIDAIATHQQVSLVYKTDVIEESGVWQGKPYTHRQVGVMHADGARYIEYLELGLVERGRAGEQVRLHLDADVAVMRADAPIKRILKWQGLEVGIEFEQGERRWENAPLLAAAYGHIRRHIGFDGEALDVYVGSNLNTLNVYRVSQLADDGDFDEFKYLIGFSSIEEAQRAYKLSVPFPEKSFGGIQVVPFEEFSKYKKDGMATIKLDNATFDVDAAIATAVNGELQRRDSALSDTQSKLQGETAKMQALLNTLIKAGFESVEDAIAAIDSLKAQLETAKGQVSALSAENDQAKNKMQEMEKTAEDGLDAKVQERLDLLRTAERLLPAEVKLDRMNNRQIKEAVISRKYADIKLDGMSDDALHGMWLVASRSSTAPASTKNVEISVPHADELETKRQAMSDRRTKRRS